jgi:DHA1 family tetracycline resistance protein-like MFS transporter
VNAAFAFIFVTVCLDFLALGVMAPVLPKLVIQLEGGDVAGAAAVTGGFGLAWAAMQFFFSPVQGALSDRFGRRPVVLLSNLGLGLDYVLMALAPNLRWLFVGRIVSGMTAASFSTASAYIADVTPPDKRAARFGMLGAAFGLGFIVGPALGGVLGQIDLRLPFWASAVLSLANASYGFFVLPESLPREKRAPAIDWKSANPLGSLALLRSQPALLGLAAVVFLHYLAHESLPSTFVLYTDYRYAWDERTVGLSLAGVGVGSTVVSALVVGPLVKRLGERGAMLLGQTLGVAGFAVFALAPVGALFCVGLPLTALWGIAGPSMQALMTRRVAPSEQGRLQGALSSIRGITGMIGPVCFTQTLAASIRAQGAARLPGATFWLAAALLAASAVVAWRVTRAGASARDERAARGAASQEYAE